MKVKVRTLQNNEEEISVDIDDTIYDVKKKIEGVLPDMPCDKQKLIFSGNILNDESKAVDILKENDIVIVMITRKLLSTNKKSSTKKNTNETTSANDLKNNEDKSSQMKDEQNTTLDKNEVKEDEGTLSGHVNNAESMLLTGDRLKETIDNICAMGFDEEVVKKAMVLAYNNPNRAIDYLTNGFPDIIDANVTNEMGENTYEYGDNGHIHQSGDNDNVSNLSNLLMNYNQLDDNSRQTIANNPEVMRHSPFFNIIRDVALSNPQRIPEIMEMIGRTDPSFLEYIRENQNEFLSALQNYGNENISIDENDLPPNDTFTEQGNQNITDPNDENFNIPITPLNENEMESIKKLESLGFPKHLALEAFIACDKNEEMAANYLFENMNDYASE
ncbi:DNA repair protein RAD23, putative [Plasmodium ovale]|uniref:UV excision repair protein RAD23 n=2 Tax=Plasmodium ovale TaxID=36330 RepID=A0A1A8W9P9_PLAOA|nr:DNA repair protein RAD23, putative [Plasmodium ovale curtisi]SBS87927.1 DNA repair protein RAD23, putative [Plasmodium ovale curtisi]SCP04107.1 DNA repair protein RAD23, putative [Plasmodium ovale]